jgi:hypothetical protein
MTTSRGDRQSRSWDIQTSGSQIDPWVSKR